jgi:hypothetical protein
MKAEARLDLLREAGVNVDDWLAKATLETLSPNEVDDEPTNRVSVGDVSMRTWSSGGVSDVTIRFQLRKAP